jgi:hypothetical protein
MPGDVRMWSELSVWHGRLDRVPIQGHGRRLHGRDGRGTRWGGLGVQKNPLIRGGFERSPVMTRAAHAAYRRSKPRGRSCGRQSTGPTGANRLALDRRCIVDLADRLVHRRRHSGPPAASGFSGRDAGFQESHLWVAQLCWARSPVALFFHPCRPKPIGASPEQRLSEAPMGGTRQEQQSRRAAEQQIGFGAGRLFICCSFVLLICCSKPAFRPSRQSRYHVPHPRQRPENGPSHAHHHH